MNKQVNDSQIQEQLRADDKEALKKVYIAYKQEFLNYAKRYPLNREDIIDCYQDAIIAMHQNFATKGLELQNSSIKTYLFGIGKNKLFRKLKKNGQLIHMEKLSDSILEVSIEEIGENPRIAELAMKLNNISESCQSLLKLFYYRNLTIDEIVEVTDYKDGNTVRSHKSRCIRRLKSLFNKM